MTYTLPFTDLGKHDAGSAGGKGASLGEMTNASIPVPPGFVVLAHAFEHFLQETDLVQEIDAILKTVDTHAIHTVEKASADIQALVLRAFMPGDISREILSGFRGLDTLYVAVRSSATAEDGADHAWAGQLDSFLNTTEETLIQNVQKCWASLFTPRAIFYRFEKGLNSTHISVAVVVQAMINSEKSGIAFSVHPVTEDPDQMIIEAGFGLGEAIVSGQVTPDSYVVSKSKHTCIDINVNDQGRALYRNERGGPPSQDASAWEPNTWKDLGEKGKEQVLTEAQILELAGLVKKIEDHYGFPCDIEWCFEDGVFYIVQSRPITTLTQERKKEVDADNGINPNTFHKNGSWKNGTYLNGIFFKHMDEEVFREELGFPVDFHTMICINDEFWYPNDVRENYIKSAGADIKVFLKRWNDGCERSIQRVEDFLEDNSEKEFRKASNSELLELLTNFHAILQPLSSYIVPYPYFAQVIENTILEQYPDASFEGLRPITYISSERLNHALLKIQIDDTEALKKIQEAYGWYNLNLLRGRILNLKDVKEFHKRAQKPPQVAQNEILFLREVQRLMWLKFERVDALNKALYKMSTFFHEILERMGLQETDWELVMPDEFTTFLENGAHVSKDTIVLRRTHRGIIKKNGKVRHMSTAEFGRYKEIFATDTSTTQDELTGQIATAGKRRGRARVIWDPNDISKLKKEEILVIDETLVQHEPYMKYAAGMVVEMGGLLSHSAIFAREFKIPTVVGVANATKIIRDGDMVEVDADNGVVRILKKDSEQSEDTNVSKFANYTWEPHDAPAVLLTLHAFLDAGTTKLKSLIGDSYAIFSVYFKENQCRFGFAEEDLNRLGKDVYMQIKENPSSLEHLKKEAQRHFKEFEKVLKPLNRDYLSTISEQQLHDHFVQFYSSYTNAYAMPIIANALDFYTQRVLSKDVGNLPPEESEATESLYILHTPTIRSYVSEAEDLLLRIGSTIENSKASKRIFQEGDAEKAFEYAQKTKPLFEAFKKHADEYFWLENNYAHVKVLTVQHFINKLVDIFRSGLSPKMILEKTQEEFAHTVNTRKKFLKKYKEHVDQTALTLSDFAMWARDVRKKYNQIGNHYLFLFLQEVAHRNGVPKDLLAFSTPSELMSLLKTGSINLETLENRAKQPFFAFSTPQGSEFLYGENVDAVYKKMYPNLETSEEKNLKGVQASRGKASGNVRVILKPSEFERMRDGDVLVTTMTRPEFVPLMKKASAILTDEGGITSHASIVSRELGKPCIIGTKIATQILKDGDFVEVDADNGVVRVIG